MSSVHKSHDELHLAWIDNSADNGTAVVHGGALLPNRVRRNVSRLTVLSSLLMSLGVAFLVMRCFIFLKSRTAENEYAINLRRLALDRGKGCPVSIHTRALTHVF